MGFTGRTGNDQRLGAASQLIIDQSAECRQIERAISRERGSQCANTSTNVQESIPLQSRPYMLLGRSQGEQVSVME
jgi:hypothetical protein